MKKFLFFAIISILIASCNKPKVVKEYFDNGTLKSEREYVKGDTGMIIKSEILFHENGKKYIEGNFKDGKRDGRWASWFDNGKLWSEGFYQEGKSNGVRNIYHQNGKIFIEGKYKMGKKVGQWRYFNENGEMINSVDYGE